MSDQIEQAIKIALKRLVKEITRNGQLVRFETAFQQRKLYDQHELQYIENQRLRKELGTQYQSSDSEEEKQNPYSDLTKIDLKKMMRRKLIENKFDEDVLLPIIENTQTPQVDNEDFVTTKIITEEPVSTYEIKETELRSIKETKQNMDEEEVKPTNFGLEFIIQQLEKIQKMEHPASFRTGLSI